jgi:hypothetical protein
VISSPNILLSFDAWWSLAVLGDGGKGMSGVMGLGSPMEEAGYVMIGARRGRLEIFG